MRSELAPVDATFSPELAHRDVYDLLFAEFPGLYKSRTRMVSRFDW